MNIWAPPGLDLDPHLETSHAGLWWTWLQPRCCIQTPCLWLQRTCSYIKLKFLSYFLLDFLVISHHICDELTNSWLVNLKLLLVFKTCTFLESCGVVKLSYSTCCLTSKHQDTGLDVLRVECSFKDLARASSVFTFYLSHWCSHPKTTWVWRGKKKDFNIQQHDKQPEEQSSGIWSTEPWLYSCQHVRTMTDRGTRDGMLELRRPYATIQILSQSGQEGQTDEAARGSFPCFWLSLLEAWKWRLQIQLRGKNNLTLSAHFCHQRMRRKGNISGDRRTHMRTNGHGRPHTRRHT